MRWFPYVSPMTTSGQGAPCGLPVRVIPSLAAPSLLPHFLLSFCFSYPRILSPSILREKKGGRKGEERERRGERKRERSIASCTGPACSPGTCPGWALWCMARGLTTEHTAQGSHLPVRFRLHSCQVQPSLPVTSCRHHGCSAPESCVALVLRHHPRWPLSPLPW